MNLFHFIKNETLYTVPLFLTSVFPSKHVVMGGMVLTEGAEFEKRREGPPSEAGRPGRGGWSFPLDVSWPLGSCLIC